MKLKGKTALITGAATRIGREIAVALAKSGANIVIHYRSAENDARSLVKEILGMGARAYLVQADFSPGGKPATVKIKRFADSVYRQVSHVDVLINNAAIFYPTPFEEVNESEWENFLTVNLKTPFFLAQIFGTQMLKKKSGKIVNLIDWTALCPPKKYLPYAISKAGLLALTTGLAKELAPSVQVLGIAPGPILPSRGMTERQRKIVVRKTLLKRFGHPRDIAQTVRFFVEDTDYITGAVIPVDGGASIF